jgi:hypothetical protein
MKAIRIVLTLAVLGATLTLPAAAHAENRREYVNKYVMLMDWVSRSQVWVRNHMEDTSLCRMSHSIAERHVEMVRRMTPPTEFLSIHPHLLLVIENTERMYACAASGNRISYRRHYRIVQEEMQMIAELLEAEGHFMPEIEP